MKIYQLCYHLGGNKRRIKTKASGILISCIATLERVSIKNLIQINHDKDQIIPFIIL